MNTILHVMNYGAPYRGNFIESIENLNANLQDEGLKNIYLFCEKAKKNDASIWIEEMNERGAITEFLTPSHDDNVKIIKKMIEENSVKLVHTHFITRKQYSDINNAVPKNIPIIMHMHNHSVQGNPLKEHIRRLIYRRCIFLACSDSVFNSLKRDYPSNEKYEIDNGVYFPRLDSYSEISEDEYGISAAATKLLIFGFDFYRKGVDLALEAVKDLRKTGKDYVLIVSVADNFDFVVEQVKLILGDLPGWVKIIKSRNDIATLFNYADIFLSPSREEGLPYSVLEAGYCNCSVVLSDISAQKNIKIKYGYWFKNEDIEGLKKTITLADKEHVEKLSNLQYVQDYMKNNYSVSTWSKKVISLYKDILARA